MSLIQIFLTEGIPSLNQTDVSFGSKANSLENTFDHIVKRFREIFIPRFETIYNTDVNKYTTKEAEEIFTNSNNRDILWNDIKYDLKNEMLDFKQRYNISFVYAPSVSYTDDAIENALFAVQKGRPVIFMKVDFLKFFLTVVYKPKELEHLKNTYVSFFLHEIQHRLQYKKYGINVFNKGAKAVENMKEYIGTPLEIPAWGVTIGMMMYLHLDKNKNKALQTLRTLDFYSVETIRNEAIRNMVKYVFNSAKENNKKSKKLLKYAFLTIENT